MRIGVVTTSYPRFLGDPSGNFVAELSDWILRSGHTVEVIAAGDSDVDDAWQDMPVQRVSAASGLFYQGGAPDALGQRGAALGAARFSARLAAAVRRRARHWDGIVAHWLAPSALAAAMAAPRLPLWAIAHGGDVHLLRKLKLTSLAATVLARPGVHVNFVSQALRETFSEARGPRVKRMLARSSVGSMGVDLEHFQGLAPLRDKNTRPSLLFLGRLVPIKGVDILLDALAGLEQDWDITVAGSGPSEGELKAQADALGLAVRWTGEVHGPDRDALLAKANVVVIPSRAYQGREEGMPRVALEALAVGAELVVSDSGGLREIPESVCHRVPGGDSVALRSAIRALGEGGSARYKPSHWLEDRGWDVLAPRLLPGLRPAR